MMMPKYKLGEIVCFYNNQQAIEKAEFVIDKWKYCLSIDGWQAEEDLIQLN